MVEIIITSTVLILMLMLYRKLCWGKISRRLQYGLWLLVVLRLLIPAQLFTSSLSIMNLVEYAQETVYEKWQELHNENEVTQNDRSMPGHDSLQSEEEKNSDAARLENIREEAAQKVLNASGNRDGSYTVGEQLGNAQESQQKTLWKQVLFGIYIAGICLTGGCIILCNMKFHSQLAADKVLIGKEGRLNVYKSSCVKSPCLCGLFRPAIYMTEKALLSRERKEHILLHEMTHYRHFDHIWAFVRSLCLVLYWFHPLVWIAARLSMEDSELACDEGTFVRLGDDKREAYGRTLIEMTTERTKGTRLLYCATGMVNGKKEIKKRITAIAFYQKPVVWIAVLAVAIAVLLSACTAGADKQDAMEETTEQGITEQETGEQIEESLQLAPDIVMNADGSFRLSEYEVELTGDKVKDRIVFDVLYWAELGSDNAIITKEELWDKLWPAAEIRVKVLEGKEKTVQNADKEVILEEYSFSGVHAGNGNLAVIDYNGQMCILRYANLMYQGFGSFEYQVWQILSSETGPVLLEEMSASYFAPGNGENDREAIEQVIQVGDRLDSFLSDRDTIILLNASGDEEECYLYGSEEGLLNGVRRQNSLEVFLNEVGGTGLELTLKDYFYPNGMEPITVLPEDAEAQILAGEILCMEVSRINSTAGRLDLDGDGEKEVLYLEALGGFMNDDGWGRYNQIDSDYRVRVNDQYYENYGDNVDPVLMAFSPDGREILLAIYDDGPSADPETVFFRYDETGVLPAGNMPADLRLATINEDGLIKCTFRADMLQTEWAWGYYYWNGSEIVRREDDIYYFVDDSKWREEYQVPLVLLREITVFAERSEDSEAITMKPQKVRNVATDNSEWILLEAEDGTSGWIRIVQFCFPSEESDPFELFEGLNMAD